MSGRARYRLAVLSTVLACTTLGMAQEDPGRQWNREFQTAVTQYNAGHYAASATQLELLAPRVPNSFQVQELLGLVYAAMSQDAKAIPPLEAAVRLRPNSGAARTNLAASLSRLGRTEEAEEQFRKALVLSPNEYTANHDLGVFYAQLGKIAEARPLLARAQQIEPSAYDNGYDLAMADLLTNRLAQARQDVQILLRLKNTGELHNLLAQIDEKDGKFVDAANEFEIAAHMDPSEDNLFDWGSELLMHRAYGPATSVFKAAAARYPESTRVILGLGLSYYASGLYQNAVKALLTATNLEPSEPSVYFFLSKAYDSSPSDADDVIRCFQRYATLHPNTALAQYYYAMSLWKGREVEGANVDLTKVESLLKRAIVLDDSLVQAHMELGDLYAGQHRYAESVPEYERAEQLSPTLADAHYRLGTAYVHLGEKTRAEAEFAVYQKLRAQQLANRDKMDDAVEQFLFSTKNTSATTPSSAPSSAPPAQP